MSTTVFICFYIPCIYIYSLCTILTKNVYSVHIQHLYKYLHMSTYNAC